MRHARRVWAQLNLYNAWLPYPKERAWVTRLSGRVRESCPRFTLHFFIMISGTPVRTHPSALSYILVFCQKFIRSFSASTGTAYQSISDGYFADWRDCYITLTLKSAGDIESRSRSILRTTRMKRDSPSAKFVASTSNIHTKATSRLCERDLLVKSAEGNLYFVGKGKLAS